MTVMTMLLRLERRLTPHEGPARSADAFHQWLVKTGKLEERPEGVAARWRLFYARRSDFGLFHGEQMQPLLQAGLVRHLREKSGGT